MLITLVKLFNNIIIPITLIILLINGIINLPLLREKWSINPLKNNLKMFVIIYSIWFCFNHFYIQFDSSIKHKSKCIMANIYNSFNELSIKNNIDLLKTFYAAEFFVYFLLSIWIIRKIIHAIRSF